MLFTLVTLGCASGARSDGASSSSVFAPSAVTLERGSCRGRCPAYRVTVHADGRVQFAGVRAVRVLGPDSARVSAKDAEALLARFMGSSFRRIASDITLDSPECGTYVADLPTATLALTGADSSHRVTYDPGCRSHPSVLDSLAELVDSVAGSRRWYLSGED